MYHDYDILRLKGVMLSMIEQQFSDELVEALKDLNQFIIKSASADRVSIHEFQDALHAAMSVMPETAETFSAIIDRAISESEGDNLSPEALSDIMESLMDDLNDASPILRVIHNPSDQWSVVEKLSGDGYLEAIAYFASPNIAENALDFLSGQVDNT